MKDTYQDTLTDCVFALAHRIDAEKAVLVKSGPGGAVEQLWCAEIYDRGHVSYGTTHRFDFEIKTLKGKPTRKWFHAAIYRMDSGRYELTSYIL